MSVADILLLCLLLAICTVIGICLFYERRASVPPAPTLPWVKRRMIRALKAHMSPQTAHIAELGSGWGGPAFSLARHFPQSRIYGFEISPIPYWFSQLISVFYKNVRLQRRDFFEEDLSGFDAVVFYLTPKLTDRLEKKFRRELRPGTLIISNAFALPGREPVQVLEGGAFIKIPVYVYRV